MPRNTIQARAVHNCLEGYQLVGERVRVCQANHRWSGRPPVCERPGWALFWGQKTKTIALSVFRLKLPLILSFASVVTPSADEFEGPGNLLTMKNSSLSLLGRAVILDHFTHKIRFGGDMAEEVGFVFPIKQSQKMECNEKCNVQ